jgi:hypothetical protein
MAELSSTYTLLNVAIALQIEHRGCQTQFAALKTCFMLQVRSLLSAVQLGQQNVSS